MGSFSWTKADKLTKVANIVEGKVFKCLIPKEFGGGFIKDYYQGYGRLDVKEDGTPKYDMYELLAFWNADKEVPSGNGETVHSILKYDGAFPLLKEIDQYTDHNRKLGIKIGCYDEQINNLKYPLKLVSASYNGTYEECDGRSYGDPNQGWTPSYRDIDEVTEFIHRRFAKDCNWIDGNCYYFTVILKDRFQGGVVYYDVTSGHFIYSYNGKFYDWAGVVYPGGRLVKWDEFNEYDCQQRSRIIENCLK